MQYRSQLTPSEIEEQLNSLTHKGLVFFPTNKILYISKKDKRLIIKGIICTTKVTIEKTDTATELELRTNYNWTFYFLQAFLATFFLAFIFSDNVTINGNQDPSILQKLGFVVIGVVLFSIPVAIVAKLKADFIKQIEKKIQLK